MIYLIKLNIAIALFYFVYRMLFADDTFFRYRRFVLIAAMILSAVIPLMNIGIPESISPTGNTITDTYVTQVLPMLTVTADAGTTGTIAETGNMTSTGRLLLAAYLAVTAILLLRLAWRITAVARLAVQSPVVMTGNTAVRLIESNGTAFSFMRWIFSDATTLKASSATDILNHERTHVEQWHTADVLLSELMCAVCWINPTAWAMKRQIRINLEYLADEHVLAQGTDARAYQYNLLALACPSERNIAISNNFNVLPLKKRIKMMNKKRTAPHKRAKYLLLLPLAAIMLAASSAEILARKSAPAIISAETTAENTGKQADNDTTVYGIAEVLPVFINKTTGEKGESAMWKFMISNLKYPIIAQKAGIEARVIVKFIVNNDGTVSDVTVVKSARGNRTKEELDKVVAHKRNGNEITNEPSMRISDCCDALDAEAIRVVNEMTWTPAKQKDEPVRMYFTMPISFRLK